MHEAYVAGNGVGEEVFEAIDVDTPGDFGSHFALFEGTVTSAIQDGAKLVSCKEAGEGVAILGVAGEDIGMIDDLVIFLLDADDLAGVAVMEIMKGVKAGYASDAGNEQG